MVFNLVALSVLILGGVGYWAAVNAQEYTGGVQPQFPFLARFCRWCGIMITKQNQHLHGKSCPRRRSWGTD